MGAPQQHAVAPGATGVTVVANQLVQDAFRYRTGIRPGTGRQVLTATRLDTLASSTHGFLPHPFDLAAGAEDEKTFEARMAELHQGAALTEEEFSRRASTLVEPQLGVLGELAEDDLAQLPLHVTRTAVADPVGLLGDGPRPVVFGAGIDFASARHRAALRALATYGSLMVDPRRLVDAHGGALTRSSADPSGAVDELRAGRISGWVRAQALTDGEPRLIRAERVFPALRTPRRPYVAPCGVAAGYRWSAAVTAGLLQHCRRITIEEALAAPRPFPRVDLASTALDPVAARYAGALESTGAAVTVHDITGRLGVPTFAFRCGDDTVAYGCGASDRDALHDGLLEALLWHQARANDEPCYAPPRYASLPAATAASGRRRAGDRPLGLPDLVSRLAALGYLAAAVPLDHDPQVHRTIPAIVNVVMTR